MADATIETTQSTEPAATTPVQAAATESTSSTSIPASLSDIDVAKSIGQEIEQVSAIYNLIIEFFVTYSFQIIGALIIMGIGVIVARKIGDLVLNLCAKKNIDVTLSGFIAAFARVTVIVMVAIISLGKLGISVTPFLAAVGAISLGAGLAVQGLLSNYSAGLNIIITRPFVVGDTIEVQGVSGLVKAVHLAYTILVDEDGTEITIPNRHIIGEIIHNSYEYTLAELSIGIAYSEDASAAVSLIKNTISNIVGTNNSDNAENPAHKNQVGINDFGDSSVNIGIRVWLPTTNYYEKRFEINMAVYDALNNAGINIPFPQREVRMLQEQA